VYAFLAGHRQRVFPDEMFADLFGSGEPFLTQRDKSGSDSDSSWWVLAGCGW
jgi:hypothetical protein